MPTATSTEPAGHADPAGQIDRTRRPGAPRSPRRSGGLLGRLAHDRVVVRFAVVGAGSALAFFTIYAVLRLWLGPQPADLVALVTTAVANTAVNRRVTFAVTGRHRALTHQVQGLVVFGAGWAVNAGALALASAAGVRGRLAECAVLVLATAVATVVRFVLMRSWVFRDRAS